MAVFDVMMLKAANAVMDFISVMSVIAVMEVTSVALVMALMTVMSLHCRDCCYCFHMSPCCQG